MRASEGATAKDGHADSTNSLFIGDADVAALRLFLDGHFRDDRNSHARADHAEKTAELAAFENDLRMEPRAITGGDGRIAKTVAVAQQKKRLLPEITQRDRPAAGESMFFR